MKGDFTRSTFDPARHYSGVRMQQGRMQVDADWNEHEDIIRHRSETGTLDALGASGTPLHDAGFSITPAGNDLTIGSGRYYVDGILCENEDDVPFTEQPVPGGTKLPTDQGRYIAFLDVSTRHVSARGPADPRAGARRSRFSHPAPDGVAGGTAAGTPG